MGIPAAIGIVGAEGAEIGLGIPAGTALGTIGVGATGALTGPVVSSRGMLVMSTGVISMAVVFSVPQFSHTQTVSSLPSLVRILTA